MRILLFSPSNIAFTVATPEQQPLGGIASCVCYLARALAARGHDVSVVAMLPEGAPQANWLPTPKGIPYSLTFRFYRGKGAVAQGTYFPPPLVRQ